MPPASASWLRAVPACLVGLRLILAPLLLIGVILRLPGPWLAVVLTAAFLSDVFDGISARHLGVATDRLRIADSRTDVILYLCVFASVWILNAAALGKIRGPIAVLVALQLASWILDRIKFRRSTALHSYTAKAWGITLFAAALAVFLRRWEAECLWVALVIGYVSNVEDIAIKLVLPVWARDVGSIWHALQIRKAAIQAGRSSHDA